MKILETPRLILRTWQESDLEPMAMIDKDPRVCEYLPGIGNKEATKAGIERIKLHYNKHGFSAYAVELKSTGEMIGFLGLMVPSFKAHFLPNVEIAWRLTSKHWNKGYATEGAKAVLNYAFTKLNLPEVVSFTVVNNQASRRVMEKIGMHHNPIDDFDHPKLSDDSPLKRHVLYKITKFNWLQTIIFDLEQSLLNSDVRHSKSQLDLLISNDFYEFGSSGNVYTKQDVLKSLPQEHNKTYVANNFKLVDLGDNTVLVTYQVKIDKQYSLRSSIWKFIDNRFQLIFHQGTKMY